MNVAMVQFGETLTKMLIKPVDSSLICAECKNLLTRPRQTPCGHRICEECLETLARSSPKSIVRCPIDNEELILKDVFYDKWCERDIQKLGCYCLNEKAGCDWKGDLASLKVHIEKCKYTQVVCPNEGCGVTMERENLQDHEENSCDYRLLSCKNCGQHFAQSNLENHYSRCGEVIVQCVQECGTSLRRKDMEDHVNKICPNQIMSCFLQQYGCEFEGTRADLEKHNADLVEQHGLLLAELNKEMLKNQQDLEVRIQTLETEREDVNRQILDSKEFLALTKQDVHILQSKTRVLEKHLDQQKRKIDQLHEVQVTKTTDDVSKVEAHFEELRQFQQRQEKRMEELAFEIEIRGNGVDSLYGNDRRLNKIEHMCATNEIQVEEHDLRVQLLENTSYDGQYIWKINNWSQRLHDAKIGKTPSIYSPPFYVGRFGYKVCGRVYPNGDGIGKGTHLSLFFVVMKGEYDSLLPWPFRQKVSFKLIDPNRFNDVTDTFRPDPNSSSFKKPVSSMNIASGTPKFASSKALDSYVIDDTLFIKISVDQTGLVSF